MEASTSLEDFLEEPLGKTFSGRSFLLWVHSPTLAGAVYFAYPDDDDVAALLRLMPLPGHARLAKRYDVLVDAGGLEAISSDAFTVLTTHLQSVPEFAPRVRRLAIVRPDGLVGAAIAGLFYEAVQNRFAAALFSDRREALAWIARDDASDALSSIDQAVDALRGLSPILRALRSHLTDALSDPQLGRAARSLGTSARTLQRALADARTTFRAEVDRARVRAAERLLTETEAKISAIARRVGVRSASHFAALFRRVTGETPAEFRARRHRSTS